MLGFHNEQQLILNQIVDNAISDNVTGMEKEKNEFQRNEEGNYESESVDETISVHSLQPENVAPSNEVAPKTLISQNEASKGLVVMK